MSLPKRLYDTFCKVKSCSVVVEGKTTPEALQEFQDLVNEAQPVDDVEEQQKNMVKSMYHSNHIGFMRYVSDDRNRVGALVLLTESKRIVDYFNLRNKVHISWDRENKRYTASLHNRIGVAANNASTTNTRSKDKYNNKNGRHKASQFNSKGVKSKRHQWVKKQSVTTPEQAAELAKGASTSWADNSSS